MSVYPREALADLNWRTNPPSLAEIYDAYDQMITARDNVIDMVKVNGVWMTPEDAAAR